MEDRSPGLPKGWAWTTISEITSSTKNAIKRGPFGSAIKKEFFVERGFKVYEQQNAINNDFSLGHYYISKEKFSELADFEVKPGEFIISCSGTIGRIAQVPDNAERGIINQALLKIAIDPRLISPKYFIELFRSQGFQKKILSETRGVAITNINSVKDIKTTPISLPPLPEQHRIVAKIEELFTRLDTGVEALKKIKVQLKRYRQAVLKYAFEGKLTQEWREAHKGELEPASVLLERIKEQRKKEAKGIFKELPKIDTSELPELPDGWVWTRVGNISNIIHYGYTASSEANQVGPKLLRITDIQDNSVNWDSVPYCKIDDSEKGKYLLKEGDLVFARTGATVGKSFLIRGKIPEAVFASYLIRIILDKDIDEAYVYKFFQSNYYWSQIHKGKIGIGQPNVNAQILSNISIPLPSFHEQNKIVEEIESRLSIADNIEKVAEQSLKQSERFRQSILKQAFEGKLVPQDPTDEPAEKLLERIKEEKAKREVENRGEKKHRNKKSKQLELI
jgi:type I restriction enzyme S subunit